MIKTIMIEDHPIEVNSSLGWFFDYEEQFGNDILPDLLPLLDAALGALADLYDTDEDVNVFEKLDDEAINRIIISLSSLKITTVVNILWAMYHNAGGTKKPMEFINQFEVFPMDVVVPELFWLIVKSSVSSKNSQRLLEKLPPQISTRLPSAELQED